MPCGWEGNRRSGVALAMRHRLQWFIHLRAHGPDREMSTRPTLSCGVWPVYLVTTGTGQSREPALCQLYRRTFVRYELRLTVQCDCVCACVAVQTKRGRSTA